MKKFLSLVLALVMTMSLVTVSAGAKTFKDDSKINYLEAVAVMKEIDVIDGYADGSFNPANILTRQAAAKIICNLILGPTTAADLAATEAPYKDVPASSQFAGYIAYCKNTGIISGYADGSFQPTGTLTGYAFMKMLLGALGYDQTVEGYVGENWKVNVAKRALALGLDEDLIGAFNGSKSVNREEACLYSLNMLNQKMVNYGMLGVASATTMGTKTFMQTYFKNLKAVTNTKNDKWGRPSVSHYTWKNEPVIYIAEKPVATYNVATTECDICSDLDEDKAAVMTATWTNGKESTADVTLSALATKKTVGAQGQIVEIYENGTKKDKNGDEYDVYRMVIIDTYLAEVTSVTKAKFDAAGHLKTQAKLVMDVFMNGEKTVVTLKSDDDFEYAKGDMVLVQVHNDKTKSDILGIAETIDGVQTVIYKNAAKHTVDGETYMDAVNYSLDEAGKNGTKAFTWFFDQFGNVIGSKAIASVKAYGIVTYIELMHPVREDDYVVADILYMDGTEETDVQIAKIDKKDAVKVVDEDLAKNAAFIGKHLYEISIDKDGVATLKDTAEMAGAKIVNKKTSITAKGEEPILVDNTTVFVNRTGKGTKSNPYKFDFVTGMNAVDNYKECDIHYVLGSDGYADYVFIIGSADAETTYQFIFVADDASSATLKTDENGVKYHTALGCVDMEGEDIELNVKKENWADLKAQLTTVGALKLVKIVDGYVEEVTDITEDAVKLPEGDVEAIRVVVGTKKEVAAAVEYHNLANFETAAKNYNMTEATALIDGVVADVDEDTLSDEALIDNTVKTIYMIRNAKRPVLAQTIIMSSVKDLSGATADEPTEEPTEQPTEQPETQEPETQAPETQEPQA